MQSLEGDYPLSLALGRLHLNAESRFGFLGTIGTPPHCSEPTDGGWRPRPRCKERLSWLNQTQCLIPPPKGVPEAPGLGPVWRDRERAPEAQAQLQYRKPGCPQGDSLKCVSRAALELWGTGSELSRLPGRSRKPPENFNPSAFPLNQGSNLLAQVPLGTSYL